MSYEAKLKDYLVARGLNAEHLVFEQSCHSVAEAAEAAGVGCQDLLKSVCMIAEDGRLVVGIVKGEDQVSTSRVGKLLEIPRPRPATPEEMLARTGYPCGGTPPFGFEAVWLIDPRVLEMPVIYGGGGTDRSLVKLAPSEIVRANGATVARIRR